MHGRASCFSPVGHHRHVGRRRGEIGTSVKNAVDAAICQSKWDDIILADVEAPSEVHLPRAEEAAARLLGLCLRTRHT